MMLRRRQLLLGAAAAIALPVHAGRFVRGTRSGGGGGGGDIPSANALPAGSLSFTVAWDAVSGASGYVVYVATSAQAFADPSLYTYRYLVSGGSSTSTVISSVQSGTKYVRVAAHDGTWVAELSPIEIEKTPA